MGLHPPRVRRRLDAGPRRKIALALSVPANQRSADAGWGFHTVRSGIDLGDDSFRSRDVGVVHA